MPSQLRHAGVFSACAMAFKSSSRVQGVLLMQGLVALQAEVRASQSEDERPRRPGRSLFTSLLTWCVIRWWLDYSLPCSRVRAGRRHLELRSSDQVEGHAAHKPAG